jgi:hypothetical protein
MFMVTMQGPHDGQMHGYCMQGMDAKATQACSAQQQSSITQA